MTFPGGRVALGLVRVDAHGVAVAGNTLNLWISPHVVFTLVTLSSSVTRPEERVSMTISIFSVVLLALALPSVEVAGLRRGSDGVALAILAALSTGNLPVVLHTLTAVEAHHIGQTVTLASHAVAGKPGTHSFGGSHTPRTDLSWSVPRSSHVHSWHWLFTASPQNPALQCSQLNPCDRACVTPKFGLCLKSHLSFIDTLEALSCLMVAVARF